MKVGLRFLATCTKAVGCAVLLSLTGCGKAEDPSQPAPSSTASVLPALAEDRSLQVGQYVDLGMPAPDRDWAPEDYYKAIEVLRKIAAEDVLRLPRLESPRSAAVMARLVSGKNLDVLRNRGLPFEQRMKLVNGFTTSTKAMLLLYAEPESKGIHFDREIVAIVNFEASGMREMMALGLQFFATLAPEEASNPVRREGWAKMWNGMATVAGARMAMIGERSHYRSPERLLLVRGLDELLAEFYVYLPEMTRREIPLRLAQLILEEPEADVRAALESTKKTIAGDLPAAIAGPGKPTSETPVDSGKPKPTPSLLKTQAGTAVAGGWFSGEASDGSFTLEFPQPYNETEVEVTEKEGVILRMRSLGTRTPSDATFSVLRVSRSDGKFLKGDPLEGYAEDFKKKGELRKASDVVLGTWPGKEIEIWNRQSETRCRVFAKNGQVITLIVEVPFGQTSVLKADGDRFFGSLKLKE